MEQNKNRPESVMLPVIEPILGAIGHFIKRLVSFCPLEAPNYMSDHYTHPLDRPLAEEHCVIGRIPLELWDE